MGADKSSFSNEEYLSSMGKLFFAEYRNLCPPCGRPLNIIYLCHCKVTTDLNVLSLERSCEARLIEAWLMEASWLMERPASSWRGDKGEVAEDPPMGLPGVCSLNYTKKLQLFGKRSEEFSQTKM